MPYEAEPVDEIDPVCGMEVDPEQARELGLEAERGERRFVFCGKTCLDAFRAEPARYVKPEEPRLV